MILALRKFTVWGWNQRERQTIPMRVRLKEETDVMKTKIGEIVS